MTASTDPDSLVDVISSFRERERSDAFRYRTRFRTFSWSYRETYSNVLRLRTLLKRNDLRPGDPVMIWAPNSPAWVWVYLASILHGSPVVPIDMGSHPDFVQNVATETNAALLFSSRLNESLDASVQEHCIEDFLFPEERDLPRSRPSRRPGPDAIAEVIYTSGTTGTPKGTILTHRNLIANQNSLIDLVSNTVNPGKTFVSVLPLSHAFEQTVGFWYPVRTDGTITYLQTLKPSEIFSGLKDEQADAMVAVPRFLSLFRDAIFREAEQDEKKEWLKRMLSFSESYLPMALRPFLFRKIHNAFGGNLQFFVVGGAPLDDELEQFWTNIGVSIFQGYGLTETGPVLTCNSPDAHRSGTVGQPLPGVHLRTTDDGEVLARGDNVFPGYFKQPELNNEVFTDGWFHTGDLGSLDQDHFLTLNGRKKNVIVTEEGLNVYPEDIEEVLNRFEEIEDACVLHLNDRITAVLLLSDDGLEPEHLIDEANENLSQAQQIQDWRIWPESDFPRTTTLKIRRMDVRDKLEEEDEETSKDDSDDVSVTSSGDELLQILTRVTDEPEDEIQESDQLGPDLGLSSVDRLELVTLVEQKMYVDLEEEDVNSETSIEELRSLIEHSTMSQDDDKFRRWTRNPFWTALRIFYQLFIARPILRQYCRPLRVVGKERLQETDGPCVFIANHVSHFDGGAIVDVLPGPFQTRLAIATWEEFFERETESLWGRIKKRILWEFTTICYNIFPIPQSKGFRKSMKYIGELLDHDWNVLFFPEGQRSIDGSMHPFRRGIGMIAKEMKVPIVPVRIDGLRDVLPRGASWPDEAPVRIEIGEPIASFEEETYSDISDRLWDTINDMEHTSDRDETECVPVEFYEADDCPLCHEAKQEIARYATRYPVDMNITDIETDPDLHEEYEHSIPVVFVNGTLASKGKFNERRFERLVREELEMKTGSRDDSQHSTN